MSLCVCVWTHFCEPDCECVRTPTALLRRMHRGVGVTRQSERKRGKCSFCLRQCQRMSVRVFLGLGTHCWCCITSGVEWLTANTEAWLQMCVHLSLHRSSSALLSLFVFHFAQVKPFPVMDIGHGYCGPGRDAQEEPDCAPYIWKPRELKKCSSTLEYTSLPV